MKKLRIICCALLILLPSSLFAQKTKVHALGFNVPLGVQNWLGRESDYTATYAGFNLDYSAMSVRGTGLAGFSSIFELQMGTWGWTYTGDANPVRTIDLLNIKGGWGVGFRLGEKVLLSSHGTLGFDWHLAWFDGEFEPPLWDLYTGQDFMLDIKLANHFGLHAGIDMYVPFIGMEGTFDTYPEMIVGGFGCDLKFGVCWVF